MTTNALVVSCLTIIIISLTHKIRPVLNVVLAGVLYAIGFGIIFFITGLPWLLLSTVIWSMGEILVTTNSMFILQIILLCPIGEDLMQLYRL